MAALDDVDEILRAHQVLTGGGVGAPPVRNGARLGASLLRAGTTLISAALQTEVEETFRVCLPLAFPHFTPEESERYFETARRGWGNPSPHNIRALFFRIGFSDALDGLSWKKRNNAAVISTLDAINQVRNRVAHGQPLTVNGQPFPLRRSVVVAWTSYSRMFIEKFRPLVVGQNEDE